MRAEDDLYVETGYKILHEDELFLVVDKPAPLPVHAVGRFKEKNLLSLLIRDLRPGGEGLRIVNRLDSETSGLVLVAKSAQMAGKLGILFEQRQVAKEYHAVVFGVPEAQTGTISASLGLNVESGHNIRT
ncbi:MAG: pseudouridine synthase, partial [Candidatus Firestonebacteria bacterium]